MFSEHCKEIRKYPILISMLLALVALGCTSDSNQESLEAAAVAPQQLSVRIPVQVVDVVEGAITESIELTGTAQPWDDFSVTAEIPGRVQIIQVDEGDWVDEGQLLLELDRVKRELELRSRQARLKQSENELEYAIKRLERAEALLEKGAISQSEVDTLSERVGFAESGVDMAQVAIESMEEELRDTRVYSPASGQIVDRLVSVGEAVNSSSPLFKIIQLSPLKVVTEISEPYLQEVVAGKTVRFTFDAFDESTFTGTIHRIHPVANPQSGAFPVEIRLENPRRKFLPGMVARISLKGHTYGDAIQVPLESIVNSQGEDFVFIVKDGVAHRIGVQVQERIGGFAVVEGKIQAGQQVVIRGNRNLTNGTAVELSS
jgi:RND family efflux transporter MFP subunit